MLGDLKRSRVKELQQKLRDLRSRLPERAAGFHGLAHDLEMRVSRVKDDWWKFWAASHQMEAIETSVRDLERGVEPLLQLIARAADLSEQATRLESQAGEIGDSGLEAWLLLRLRKWQAELATIGKRPSNGNILGQENRQLDLRQEDLQRCAQLCYQLKKVAPLLASSNLGEEGDARIRELAAERDRIREEVLATGRPTTEQADRLKALVQPLERLASQVIEAKSRFEGLGEKMQELRGWSRKMNDSMRERIKDLEARHNGLAFSQTDQEEAVASWQAEAENVRRGLIEVARKERAQQLEALENDMLQLADACGSQPELASRIAELRSTTIDSYQQHAEWQKRIDLHRTSFQSIAKNNELALEQRLSVQVEALGARLGELSQKTLSHSAHSDAAALELELAQLRRLQGAAAVLPGLQNCKRLDQQISALASKADQERRDLDQKSAHIRQRFSELAIAERSLGLELEDLLPPIASLLSSRNDLEEANTQASGLENQVEERQRHLLELCRRRLDEHSTEIRKAAELLDLIHDVPARLLERREIAASVSPAAAMEALAGAASARRKIEDEVAKAIVSFDLERQKYAQELATLAHDDLGPNERADAEQLRAELAGGSWLNPRNQLDALQLLAELVRKCSILFERLHQDQNSARMRQADLVDRLKRFDEALLRRYCPELARRVDGLLHGLPQRPRNWATVRYQLERAGELLGRLESHGRRLAAQELEQAAQKLKSRPESHTHSTLRQLLGRLDSADVHELPPSSLRMRIRQEADRFEE